MTVVSDIVLFLLVPTFRTPWVHHWALWVGDPAGVRHHDKVWWGFRWGVWQAHLPGMVWLTFGGFEFVPCAAAAWWCFSKCPNLKIPRVRSFAFQVAERIQNHFLPTSWLAVFSWFKQWGYNPDVNFFLWVASDGDLDVNMLGMLGSHLAITWKVSYIFSGLIVAKRPPKSNLSECCKLWSLGWLVLCLCCCQPLSATLGISQCSGRKPQLRVDCYTFRWNPYMFGICPTTASGSYSMSLGTSVIQVNSMLFEKAEMLRIFTVDFV